MSYVDGFVIAVPKASLAAYKAQAALRGRIFMEFGAKSCVECVADDVPYGQRTSFPRAVQAKDDEVVVFSWVVYENRAARDATMAKVTADDRLKDQAETFDGARMIFGGFEAFVELSAP